MRPRLGALAVILVAPALPMLASSPAHAVPPTVIYCVNRAATETDCNVRPTTVQDAINAAAADPNDNVIRIGPGPYAGPFSFVGAANNTLAVQGNNNGTGANATVLTGGVTLTDATMRNVRVAAVNGGTALTVSATTVNNVVGNVVVADSDAAPATGATGISVSGSGGPSVQNTTVNLERSTGNTGIRVSGPSKVSRVTTRASETGVLVVGGNPSVDNSLLELGPLVSTGLRVGTPASTTGSDVTATHLTVVGGAGGARGVWAFSDDATAPSQVRLINSIVRGPANSVAATAEGSGTADVDVSYSDYQTTQPAGGTIDVSEANLLNVDPAFRDPATGDYELRAGSPVVDRGSLSLTVSPDRNDLGRAFDGDGNGTQIPDMGAFELSDITRPVTTFTSGPTGVISNRQPVFQFRSENGARFQCSLDGGAFQPCGSPATTPPLPDGAHNFSVQAIDAAFNIESPPVTRTFIVDTIAPDATITKKPAKRFFKKRVKFKFAVNEPGATLQCNLDGKGWKSCNFKWKFNTKVGKHKLLVRAVDQAGNVDQSPARYKYKRLKRGKGR